MEENGMASLHKTVRIHAPVETVWAALRDVGALHTRLVPGFVIDTRLEPGARLVTFGNGSVVRELIVDLDEQAHRLVWAIVDEPFEHYNAVAQVFSEGPDRCRFDWCVDLLPHTLADHVAMMMEQGLQTIKTTMEKSSVTP
jgi:hypothetical protein